MIAKEKTAIKCPWVIYGQNKYKTTTYHHTKIYTKVFPDECPICGLKTDLKKVLTEDEINKEMRDVTAK